MRPGGKYVAFTVIICYGTFALKAHADDPTELQSKSLLPSLLRDEAKQGEANEPLLPIAPLVLLIWGWLH